MPSLTLDLHGPPLAIFASPILAYYSLVIGMLAFLLIPPQKIIDPSHTSSYILQAISFYICCCHSPIPMLISPPLPSSILTIEDLMLQYPFPCHPNLTAYPGSLASSSSLSLASKHTLLLPTYSVTLIQ